jgi:hypothetical protein
MSIIEELESIIGNDQLLEIARLAIEDTLIEYRDSRICQPMRGNGLVVRESDRTPSSLIRMGPEDAVRIGLKAIAEHLKNVP